MSEYIEIETEATDDPAVINFSTNLSLTDEGAEEYGSAEEMEEGTPLAQAISHVEGIQGLRIEGSNLAVTRDLETPWHIVVADVSAAIKDFFL
jgi:hypothetical protein